MERRDVIHYADFEAWLDKLTEGAEILKCVVAEGKFYGVIGEGATHTALLICPREIKKQTPLEILEESMKHIRDKSIDPLARKQAEWALAQIEAAT